MTSVLLFHNRDQGQNHIIKSKRMQKKYMENDPAPKQGVQ